MVQQVFTLDPSLVTSTETTATCPAIELNIVASGGVLVDPADGYLSFDVDTNQLTSF